MGCPGLSRFTAYPLNSYERWPGNLGCSRDWDKHAAVFCWVCQPTAPITWANLALTFVHLTWRTSPSLTRPRTFRAIHRLISCGGMDRAYKEEPVSPHSQEHGKRPLREKRWTWMRCPNPTLHLSSIWFHHVNFKAKIGRTGGRHV